MKLSILHQPFQVRVGDTLNTILERTKGGEFTDILFASAFAKRAGIARLKSLVNAVQEGDASLTAIVGIDHGGTSREAIEILSRIAKRLFVFHSTRRDVTFHSKLYVFRGPSSALALIGSTNLTAGGLFTNVETMIEVEYAFPADIEAFKQIEVVFSTLIDTSQPFVREITPENIETLLNLLPPEENIDRSTAEETGKSPNSTSNGEDEESDALQSFFGPGTFPVAPPIESDKRAQGTSGARTPTATVQTASASESSSPPPARCLVLQIKPHENGEIFLSKTAVNQNPSFFGFPFTGRTVPKRPGNPSYPQRSPDPIVNIRVLGARGKVISELNKYNLNTVYYERKGEIRVTATPLVSVVPHYSIMIMTPGTGGVDYEIEIHRPDAPRFKEWLAKCDQIMPGGGHAPRRFGWF